MGHVHRAAALRTAGIPVGGCCTSGYVVLSLIHTWITWVMCTGQRRFGQLASRAVDAVLQGGWRDSLPPMLLHPETGEAAPGSPITLGARGDSYLECARNPSIIRKGLPLNISGNWGSCSRIAHYSLGARGDSYLKCARNPSLNLKVLAFKRPYLLKAGPSG